MKVGEFWSGSGPAMSVGFAVGIDMNQSAYSRAARLYNGRSGCCFLSLFRDDFKQPRDGFDAAVKVRDMELFVGSVEVVVG